jgi:hypothetical protein
MQQKSRLLTQDVSKGTGITVDVMKAYGAWRCIILNLGTTRNEFSA